MTSPCVNPNPVWHGRLDCQCRGCRPDQHWTEPPLEKQIDAALKEWAA